MTDKKKVRELKRDARLERKYGSPLLRKIADNDHSVSYYYYRYRDKKREAWLDYLFSTIFLSLGILEIILLIFREDKTSTWFGIDAFWAVYWMMSARICGIEAERYADKLVSWASQEAKEKALKDYQNNKEEK